MIITIIGTGNIGRTLGKKWLQKHTVIFGVRDEASAKTQILKQELGYNIALSHISEAVQQSEVILLAVPGAAIQALVNQLGNQLNQKIILDATNNISQEVMHDLESIRQVAPQARLFRVFNSLGWENFENPILSNQTIDHFYCGDTGEAQSKVENLIRDIGLNPVYLGGLEHTSTLDSLTKLWFNLAFQKGYGRRVALKVLSE
jgi:predicted dinucleotide-binding enzyme